MGFSVRFRLFVGLADELPGENEAFFGSGARLDLRLFGLGGLPLPEAAILDTVPSCRFVWDLLLFMWMSKLVLW